MKYIEHRRHAHRKKPSPHISQMGVFIARNVGEVLQHDSNKKVTHVLTSDLPRAIETSVAMGYAVNETDPFLATIPGVDGDDFPYEAGFHEISKWLEEQDSGVSIKVKNYIKELGDLLTKKLTLVQEGEKLLVVSHGGIVELSVFALWNNDEFKHWNFGIDKCEGVLLIFDENNKCVKVEYLEI